MSNESISDKLLEKVGEILLIPVAIIVITVIVAAMAGADFWDVLPTGFSVGLTFFISAVLGIGVLLIVWFFSALAGSVKKTTGPTRTQKLTDAEKAVMEYCMLMLMVEAGEARLISTEAGIYTFEASSGETIKLRKPPIDKQTETVLMSKLRQALSETNG